MKEVKELKITDEQYTAIYKTMDYKKFLPMRGNRKLNQKNLAMIINSMKKKQLVLPIIVNDKYEVVDGQHRLHACKELGLPVYYQMNQGYTIEEVVAMNTSSENWGNMDFLHRYIEEGVEEYEFMLRMIKEYEIKIFDLFKVIAKIADIRLPQIASDFKIGTLKIEEKGLVEDFIKSFNQIKIHVRREKTSKFLTSFLDLYFIQTPFKFNFKQLLAKLEKYGYLLLNCRDKRDMLATLCNTIYSAHEKAEDKIIFYSSDSNRFHR